MAPWCIEYFRLKASEKQQVQEGLYDLAVRRSCNPHLRGALRALQEQSILPEEEGTQRGPE